MASLFSLCRRAGTNFVQTAYSQRGFTTSQALLVNRQKQRTTIRVPSKKAMAAKARRKATLAMKLDERAEKLTLLEAISVLRATEVACPNALYNLYIKTEMGNGVAVPKGRVNLPREAKAMAEDKILVFAEGRQAEEARKAGAHIVGGPELIEGVISKKYQATTILCTSALIRVITPKLGRVLGPLGLMPSERRGTVTDDIAGYIQRMQGTSEWKADKAGNIHVPIARMDFSVDDVVKNIRHFLASVKKVTGNTREAENTKNKAVGAKPVTQIKKVLLSSRHGPGIRISDF